PRIRRPLVSTLFPYTTLFRSWGLLAAFGLLSRFRVAYLVGLLIILGSLLLEHWLARRRSLKWINTAFFRLNALVSLVFLIVTTADRKSTRLNSSHLGSSYAVF